MKDLIRKLYVEASVLICVLSGRVVEHIGDVQGDRALMLCGAALTSKDIKPLLRTWAEQWRFPTSITTLKANKVLAEWVFEEVEDWVEEQY